MLSYAVALVGIAAIGDALPARPRAFEDATRQVLRSLPGPVPEPIASLRKVPSIPVLSGAYRDHEVRLEPLIDNMAWRKVPVLWLKVTVLKPNSHRGILDFLVRPGGVEVFSPSAELHYHLTLPEGWPEQACSAPTILPHRRSSDYAAYGGVRRSIYEGAGSDLARRSPHAHDLAGQPAALRGVSRG